MLIPRVSTTVVVATIFLTAAQIPPEYAQNITVYHLNPASAGAIPVNMDTGDARGDLSFYLGEFLLPLQCRNASQKMMAKLLCDNPERVDPNLVVTKVKLEVDSRTTKYSACNLCNGTDPFSWWHKKCEVGTYICDCLSWPGQSTCEKDKVGEVNITTMFVPNQHTTATCTSAMHHRCGLLKGRGLLCDICVLSGASTLQHETCTQFDMQKFCFNKIWKTCDANSPDWACWNENIPRKTGGWWYSTLKEGLCTDKSAEGSCSWKVLSTTTVQQSCLKQRLMSKVESHGPDCFRSCGPRNATSSCWISCFFDTILGTDARNSSSKPLAGMPIEDIVNGWTGAFDPQNQGGCAKLAIPKFAAVSEPLTQVVV